MTEVEASSITERDSFLWALERPLLIDVGTIIEYDRKTNHAVVQLNRLHPSGEAPTLSDVEVVFSGGGMGGVTSTVANSPCLVFVPCSVAPSLRDGTIDLNSKHYSLQGAKALPLFVSTETGVNVGFQEDGTFSVSTDKYAAMVNEAGITLSSTEGNVQRVFDGQDHRIKCGDWTNTLHADGSFERTLIDKSDGSTKVQITSDVEGGIGITQKSGISISISADGAIDISGPSALTVQSEDDISVQSKGTVTVQGDTAVEIVSAATTLKSKDGTGTLSCNGVPTPSGQGPFCGMPYCAFSGAPHSGTTCNNT